MKLKFALSVLVTALLTAGTAQAFTWHLSYYKAKAATKAAEQEACERDSQCVAYGASCERISESRIDCLGGKLDETQYGELECQTMFHWGVDRHGYAKLRLGRTHCAYLE